MGKTHYELPVDLDAESRLKTGAFYTPENIVDFMIARLLEGRVWAENREDGGCRFFVELARNINKS